MEIVHDCSKHVEKNNTFFGPPHISNSDKSKLFRFCKKNGQNPFGECEHLLSHK